MVALIAAIFSISARSASAQDVQVSGGGASSSSASDSSAGGGNASVPLWRLPVRVSVEVNGGYDDNPSSIPGGDGSAFSSVSLNLNYEFGTSRTRFTLSSGTGVTYYPDSDDNHYDPNIFLNLAIVHQSSLRLTLTANLAVRYLAEPDLTSTLTVDRRTGNYFSTDDTFAASFQWLPRFTTVTTYGLATVLYDDASASGDNRVTQTFGESLRFLYLPATSLVADYNLTYGSFDNGGGDSLTHVFQFGFDHSISSRLLATVRAGVEFRHTEDSAFQGNDGFGPHAEASLVYTVGAKTTASWNISYGTQESYISGAGASESFRTSLQATYAITPRIRAVVSGAYQHNENETAEFFPGFSLSFAEDLTDVSLGLNYMINRIFTANLGYSHIEVDSDLFFRSYSRNRYYGGLTINF